MIEAHAGAMPVVHRSEAIRWHDSRAEASKPSAGTTESGSVVTAMHAAAPEPHDGRVLPGARAHQHLAARRAQPRRDDPLELAGGDLAERAHFAGPLPSPAPRARMASFTMPPEALALLHAGPGEPQRERVAGQRRAVEAVDQQDAVVAREPLAGEARRAPPPAPVSSTV